MHYQTLIDVKSVAAHLNDPSWLFVDCRAVLGKPEAGRELYLRDHIPGAVHADLERDLTGDIVPGRTGRHPLPSQMAFDPAMSRLGVDASTQVIAYDELNGGMAAARLWWLLRWAGHDRVAVLDGGFSHWRDAGLPTRAGDENRPPSTFRGCYRSEMVSNAGDTMQAAKSPGGRVIDSRAHDRYRGENEMVDPVAGHIPGAVNLPYGDNVTPDGRFLPPEELRARFQSQAQHQHANRPVFYCGSGVSAAQNILAYVHAGFDMPHLYVGSWSDWITDPERPVAVGEG
ncbi:MAG TPA: sulfurtransferase [Chloroflexota bacterium]